MPAAGPTDLLTPEVVADVQSLHVFARHLIDGLAVGRHASRQKGASTQFKEHRAYVPGDQLRTLDWKLYGKTDRLYVRQFEEEINLQAVLAVDRSRSMLYAGDSSRGLTKYHYACGLAAALAYLLLRQQDAVGMVELSPRSGDPAAGYLPPRSRPGYLQEILHHLADGASDTGGPPPDPKPLHDTLAHGLARVRGRSLIFVLSDMLDDPRALAGTFKLARAAGHDVVALQVWDRDEVDFPFDRRVEFRDLEHEGSRQTLDCRSVAGLYRRRAAEFQESLSSACRQHGVDLLRCVSDRPCGEPLREVLSLRGRVR